MEAPRDIQESKGFRWVGQPSEAELLGEKVPGRRIVSLRPPPAHVAEAVVADDDPLETAPRWRFQGRDLIALAAIVAAVWFAVRGSEGIPFHPSGAGARPQAAELVAANITLDRQELSSLPRKAAAAAAGHNSRNGAGGKTVQTSSGSCSKRHPKPPSSGDSPDPLVQATIPGVGTVTVNQPDAQLPVDAPDLPLPGTDLPGTGALLPGTKLP